MTETSNVPNVLSDAIQQQLDKRFEAFAQRPNDLLLRCTEGIKKLGSWALKITDAEARFLQESSIAETKYNPLSSFGESAGGYYTVESFLPPWDGILIELTKEISAYRPASLRKNGDTPSEEPRVA